MVAVVMVVAVVAVVVYLYYIIKSILYITTGKIWVKDSPCPLVIGLHDVNVLCNSTTAVKTIELHSLGTSVSTRVVITVTPLTLISCGHTPSF